MIRSIANSTTYQTLLSKHSTFQTHSGPGRAADARGSGAARSGLVRYRLGVVRRGTVRRQPWWLWYVGSGMPPEGCESHAVLSSLRPSRAKMRQIGPGHVWTAPRPHNPARQAQGLIVECLYA